MLRHPSEQLASKLNAPDLHALRAISAEELQQKAIGFYSPIVDGYVMQKSVADVHKNNQPMHVTILTGWNGDEGFNRLLPRGNESIICWQP